MALEYELYPGPDIDLGLGWSFREIDLGSNKYRIANDVDLVTKTYRPDSDKHQILWLRLSGNSLRFKGDEKPSLNACRAVAVMASVIGTEKLDGTFPKLVNFRMPQDGVILTDGTFYNPGFVPDGKHAELAMARAMAAENRAYAELQLIRDKAPTAALANLQVPDKSAPRPTKLFKILLKGLDVTKPRIIRGL